MRQFDRRTDGRTDHRKELISGARTDGQQADKMTGGAYIVGGFRVADRSSAVAFGRSGLAG